MSVGLGGSELVNRSASAWLIRFQTSANLGIGQQGGADRLVKGKGRRRGGLRGGRRCPRPLHYPRRHLFARRIANLDNRRVGNEGRWRSRWGGSCTATLG